MKFNVITKEIFFLTLYFVYASCYYKVSVQETASKSCQTNSGEMGVCINIKKCDLYRDLVKKNLWNKIKKVSSSFCSIGLFSVYVCCPHKNTNNYKLINPPNCGANNDIHSRVVDGRPAIEGGWPWMVAVTFDFDDHPEDNEFMCGGSLISKRHVLTAAHCVQLEEVDFVVYLGLLNLDKRNENVRVVVEKYVIHPEYNATNQRNDIAILTLKEDVQFSKIINPICLPTIPKIRDRNFVRYMPFVAGWGDTEYNGTSSNILLETQVPVVSNSQCKEYYKNKKKVIITDGSLCAGYPDGGKDACAGDSGGPLIFPLKGSYYLIGIVSTGFRCGEPGYPGVYTRVTAYLDFILNNLN